MAKRIAVFLVLILGFAFVMSAFSAQNANSAQRPTHNRYNIVLVVDASGSMLSTDPSELRFEAIGKFVALLAERGNTIGTVVFSHDIILSRPLTDANDIRIKQQIVTELSEIKPKGYTNIGGALYTAADLLDRGANPELDSIILLLSDGNTEMPTLDEETFSLTQKAEAIHRARESGYVIHSVSLNADGTASPDELSQISTATGGLFEEVKTAQDLENVYDMFYRVIFNSLDYKNNQTEFPDSGVVEGTFKVPAIGVEEINLILSGLAQDYTLTDPAGKTHTKAGLQSATYSSDTFSVIKFTDPIAGEWSYAISGIPGDKIRIELIFNTNLEAKISLSSPEYLLNEAITITASLTQAGVALADVALYDGFIATVTVNDAQFTIKEATSADGFVHSFVPDNSGTYTITAKIEGYGHVLVTDSVVINVDNTPPVFNEDIHHKIYLLPFRDNVSVIDLSPAATDPLGRELRFEPISSAFNYDEFYIDGNELVMLSYSLSKGSIELSAIDPLGGSVNFKVYITTVNVTMWTVILLCGGGLIVLAILGAIAWLNLNKRFYGVCYVRYFNHETDDYYDEIRITNPKRGKRRLSKNVYGSGASMPKSVGFDLSKCYFQASGKRHVFLCTGERVYGQGVKDKKFKIDGEGFEVQISKRADSTRGITVRFETKKR